jgi:MtaA/CmuA family methyltransferase
MNSLERCQAVMNGSVPDRLPVIPQSFMLAAETAGIKVGELSDNADKMVEAHLVCIEKYGYDGIVIDFDDATLAEACGASIIFREDEPAIVNEQKPLLKDLRDVETLEVPDPWKSGRLPVWLEATKKLVEQVGDRIFIMGRADQGPFTLATLLRGAQQFMEDLIMEDPELIKKVIDYCRKAGTAFAKAMKDTGAHATSIGDAYAGPSLISPEMFREFALRPEIQMTKDVQDTGIPFSIHICGDTTGIVKDMAITGAKILELDWQVDLGWARKVIPPEIVLMGNIDPSDPLVLGSPEKVDAEARKIIQKTKGQGLFLSSGCAMGRNTPPENFRAMINAAKKYGTEEQLMEMKR